MGAFWRTRAAPRVPADKANRGKFTRGSSIAGVKTARDLAGAARDSLPCAFVSGLIEGLIKGVARYTSFARYTLELGRGQLNAQWETMKSLSWFRDRGSPLCSLEIDYEQRNHSGFSNTVEIVSQ